MDVIKFAHVVVFMSSANTSCPFNMLFKYKPDLELKSEEMIINIKMNVIE